MKSLKIAVGLALLLILPTYAYVEKIKLPSGVTVDYNDPVSVVKAAKVLLCKADYKGMLAITGKGEKTRTRKTINAIKENHKLLLSLKKESGKIQKFEIIGKDVFEDKGIAVVYTRWHVDRKIEKLSRAKMIIDPNKKYKKYSVVFVDYLLRKMDGKWKIISKRSK